MATFDRAPRLGTGVALGGPAAASDHPDLPARLALPADAVRARPADRDRVLSERLLDRLGGASPDWRDGVLVGPRDGSPRLERLARYVNASLRAPRVDTLHLDASPLRTAVLVELLTREPAAPHRLATRDRVVAWLSVLARHSVSLVVSRTTLLVTRTPPTAAERLAPPSATRVFAWTDATRPERLDLAAPDEVAATLARLLADVPSPRAVTVPTTARGPDLSPLGDALAATSTRELAGRREWRRWWGRGRVAEVVVVPADLDRLSAEVDLLVEGAWRCYWCDKLHFEPSVCARCHADGRNAAR